jgi:hypothetical protein
MVMMLFKPKWRLLDINVSTYFFVSEPLSVLAVLARCSVHNRRDGYNRESGRHIIYNFFLSLRIAIELSYAHLIIKWVMDIYNIVIDEPIENIDGL